MTGKELKTLIKILRSNGVVSYEENGIKLLLDPNHTVPERSRKRKSAKRDAVRSLQEQVDGLVPSLSDEEWLLATNVMDTEDDEASN